MAIESMLKKAGTGLAAIAVAGSLAMGSAKATEVNLQQYGVPAISTKDTALKSKVLDYASLPNRNKAKIEQFEKDGKWVFVWSVNDDVYNVAIDADRNGEAETSYHADKPGLYREKSPNDELTLPDWIISKYSQ